MFVFLNRYTSSLYFPTRRPYQLLNQFIISCTNPSCVHFSSLGIAFVCGNDCSWENDRVRRQFGRAFTTIDKALGPQFHHPSVWTCVSSHLRSLNDVSCTLYFDMLTYTWRTSCNWSNFFQILSFSLPFSSSSYVNRSLLWYHIFVRLFFYNRANLVQESRQSDFHSIDDFRECIIPPEEVCVTSGGATNTYWDNVVAEQ